MKHEKIKKHKRHTQGISRKRKYEGQKTYEKKANLISKLRNAKRLVGYHFIPKKQENVYNLIIANDGKYMEHRNFHAVLRRI